MVDFEDNVGGSEQDIALNVLDIVDTSKNREGQVSSSSRRDLAGIEGDSFEPHDGIEFDSHEAAYSFYQEYAKSMGFTTSIKNSRRSKKTKEFIDAKFACSRYGVTPESESGVSRKPSVKKTDCKASMHVKKKRDGKWYIHEFIKEHNHELLPALAYHFRIHRNVKLAEKNNIDILHAVSERTRKMYVEMSRQTSASQNCCLSKNEFDHQFDRGRYLALEEGDAQVILEYFVQIQKENPCFFYAIDLNEDQRVRNLFCVDAKSRKDYISFNDVVSFDTSYMKSSEKMPIADSQRRNYTGAGASPVPDHCRRPPHRRTPPPPACLRSAVHLHCRVEHFQRHARRCNLLDRTFNVCKLAIPWPWRWFRVPSCSRAGELVCSFQNQQPSPLDAPPPHLTAAAPPHRLG